MAALFHISNFSAITGLLILRSATKAVTSKLMPTGSWVQVRLRHQRGLEKDPAGNPASNAPGNWYHFAP